MKKPTPFTPRFEPKIEKIVEDFDNSFGPVVSAPTPRVEKDERVTFKVMTPEMSKIEMADDPIVEAPKVAAQPKIFRATANTLLEMEAGRKSISRFK